MNTLYDKQNRKQAGVKTALALFTGIVGLGAAGCGILPATTPSAPIVVTSVVTSVVVATADPRMIQVTITNTSGSIAALLTDQPTPVTTTPGALTIPATPTTAPGAIPTVIPTVADQATVVPTIPVSAVPASAVPATTIPTVTALPFPTDTRLQIAIAQEDFQGGYMFWIQNTREVWVLLPETLPKKGDPLALPINGQWRIYKDTYQDSEPETLATLTPPGSNLFQPKRGFGKLWRETPELFDSLGWATTPEFALSTSYEYRPAGQYDANGVFVRGPGRHIMISLSRSTFEMKEPEPGQQFGTWKKVG